MITIIKKKLAKILKAFLISFVLLFNSFIKHSLAAETVTSNAYSATKTLAFNAGIQALITNLITSGSCQKFEPTAAKQMVNMISQLSNLDAINTLVNGDLKSQVCTRKLGLFVANSAITSVLASVSSKASYAFSAGISAISALFLLKEAGISAEYARQFKLCKSELKFAPYSNNDIMEILRLANITPTYNKIIERKNKICIERIDDPGRDSQSKQKYIWLGENECYSENLDKVISAETKGEDDIFLEGNIFCAKSLDSYSSVLCAEVVSGCPCIQNIAGGIDNEMLSEIKDKSKQDDFYKHCKIIRKPENNQNIKKSSIGFIDDSCFDLSGYSVYASDTIPGAISGIFQCIIETGFNIINKPVIYSNAGGDNLTQNQADYLALMQKAINNINTLKSSLDDTEDVLFDQSSDNSTMIINAQYLDEYNNIINLIAENLTEYSDLEYSMSVKLDGQDDTINEKLFISLQNDFKAKLPIILKNIFDDEYFVVSESVIKNKNILQIIADTMQEDYASLRKSFITLNQNISQLENSGYYSVFASIQDIFKYFAITVIVLYVSFFGYKILNGKEDLSFDSLKNEIISLILVIYLVIGTGWKDFLTDTLITASNGLSGMVFITASGGMDNKIPAQKKCTNISFKKRQIERQMDDVTGEYILAWANNEQDCNKEFENEVCLKNGTINSAESCIVKLCTKKTMILRPPYETPYKLFTNGNSTQNGYYLKTYCFKDKKQSSVIDNLFKNNLIPDTGDIIGTSTEYQETTAYQMSDKMLICKPGYTMEYGYRLGELESLYGTNSLDDKISESESIIDDYSSLIKSGDKQKMLIPTAFYTYAYHDGGVSSVKMPNNIYQEKQKLIKAIESKRLEKNVNMSYPQSVEKGYGPKRDMSYIGLVDAIGCYFNSFIMDTTLDVYGNEVKSEIMIFVVVKNLFNMFTGAATSEDTTANFGDYVSRFVASLIVIILLVVTMFFIVLMFGKLLISYLSGIFMLLLLIYMSPFFIIAKLFKDIQKDIYKIWENWYNKVKDNIFQPSIAFLSNGFVIRFLTYIFYGTYGSQGLREDMYDASGNISKLCYSGEDISAIDIPYACVLKRLSSSVGADFDLFTFAIVTGKVLLILYVMDIVIKAITDFVSSAFDTKAEDTGLDFLDTASLSKSAGYIGGVGKALLTRLGIRK